ncbi:hypothetical protein D9757_011507 [Collybiopsis confluens]|uniref:Uncharacterized protein n=1 Tax=Collybiopsis confluens TaxID=2823264 RepID=A0A8H5H7A5_9AGAR|nr:hypothetical protein D9757_011507 [Collybiopsis confluens]
MFRLSYSLRLIFVGLVVISSFTCDGMPAPLPNATSLPKSPAETTPKVAPQIAPPPTKSNVTLSKSTASPKTPSVTPTKIFRRVLSKHQAKHQAKPAACFTLYHGTRPRDVASLKAGIDLKATAIYGDFSSIHAFYLTDRMKAAGQFICHNPKILATSVSIFEYRWAGSSVPSKKIYKFTEQSASWNNFIHVHNFDPYYEEIGAIKKTFSDEQELEALQILQGKTMITGPMNAHEDKDLTDNFWQYALVDQESVDKLTLVAVHDNIPCSKFPSGRLGVTDSQGPSEDFPQVVKTELGIC